MCVPSCLRYYWEAYGWPGREVKNKRGQAISVGNTACRSSLQQDKEGCGLVLLRVGRNANAGARGYMLSSLSFSPAPHVARKKGFISGRDSLLPQLEIRLWECKRCSVVFSCLIDRTDLLFRFEALIWNWAKCSLHYCIQDQSTSVCPLGGMYHKALATFLEGNCSTKQQAILNTNTAKIKQIITC